MRIQTDNRENWNDLKLNLHLRSSNRLSRSVCLRMLRKCRAAATFAIEKEINGEKKKYTNKQLKEAISERIK